MDHKFNYNADNNSDTDIKAREVVKKAFEESIRRQRVEKFRHKSFKQLSSRHQRLIENYTNFQLRCKQNERDEDLIVNEIVDGKISFAFEGMDKFPRTLVELLRDDITHIDLSMNRIKDFGFLRGFKRLKSLIVDGNVRMDMESFAPNPTLKLFYANKCKIEFPRSFIFRVSVVFPSLKYFSIMENSVAIRPKVQEGREHRMRLFAIFINPNLIHYNDKEVTDDEQQHAADFHKYLGPIDCKLSVYKTLPDTDDVRKILPVHIRNKTFDIASLEAHDKSESFDEALAAVSVSAYFTNHTDAVSSPTTFSASDKKIRMKTNCNKTVFQPSSIVYDTTAPSTRL